MCKSYKAMEGVIGLVGFIMLFLLGISEPEDIHDKSSDW